MNTNKKVFVTGHQGLVGSAVCRHLELSGFPRQNIVTATHSQIDLTDPVATKWFFSAYRPDYVIHCAAWVGGIMAHVNGSTRSILDNSRIQANVISCAADYKVEKLLFLGSACAYPKRATTPIQESDLGTGPLEPTNKGYALCKMLGIELCQAFNREAGHNFICAMPTNLYGLNDNYDPDKSHVIPGLIYRLHHAKISGAASVTLWGTGHAVREFLFADDLARACIVLMNQYSGREIVNIGSGHSVTIESLAGFVSEVVGYKGGIVWDASKPDGTPFRFLDGSKLAALGWKPHTPLYDGLEATYKDFLK